MSNKILMLLLFSGIYISCKKSEYLDANPDQSLIVPKTLGDLLAVLDNAAVMNGISSGQMGISPALAEAGSDNVYKRSADFSGSTGPSFKMIYTWNDDFYDRSYYDWAYPYRAVFYANVVLDGLSKLDYSNEDQQMYNNAKGMALFFRGYMFYQVAQVFAPVFESTTAKSQWGVVLKLRSDVNEIVKRSTVFETYERIINDLKIAKEILPLEQSYYSRPTKSACLALLARVYLSMQEYDSALAYSNASLQYNSELLDYNLLSTSSATPFSNYEPETRLNPEIIFHSCIVQSIISPYFNRTRSRVDSALVALYSPDDLRGLIFLRNESGGGKSFKGSYDGTSTLFSGITTDEMYLTRAECYARNGMVTEAINDLNKLLIKRWKNTVPYPIINVTDKIEALNIILTERRKELLFRGLRWTDLRRLNKEGANITLTRILDGQTYTLLPNSLHYTYLIPPDVMGFNSQMPQNPR